MAATSILTSILARGAGRHMEKILLGICGETEELLLGKHLKKSLRTCIDILTEGHTLRLRRFTSKRTLAYS